MLPPRPQPPASRKQELLELQGQLLRNATRFGVGALDFLLGVALGPLPESWRGGWVRRFSPDFQRASFVSGLVQFWGCVLLWGGGLILWIHGLSAEVAESADKLGGGRDDAVMQGHAMLYLNPLLPLIYTFTTLQGLLTAVFAMGGAVRLISLAAWRENAADPTLAGIDALLRLGTGRIARQRRELSKGAPAPDRLIAGDGQRHDLRIVSREDYPWRVGVSVIVDSTAYRVVDRAETRDAGGRLRLQYDLKELSASEVMRGVRRYAPGRRPVDERARLRRHRAGSA